MTPPVLAQAQAPTSHDLPEIAHLARQAYARRIADNSPQAAPWWTAVIITASSARQADRYRQQLADRQARGHLPAGVRYLVVPDLDDARIGSGGATLNALHELAEAALAETTAVTLEEWWAGQRVLIIHSGGDSRRLPQYALAGKLFSALPIKAPWGEVCTVFDEILALSTLWVRQMSAGLVVMSGDVLLTFDARALHWHGSGVAAVGIRQPIEVGHHHGVYVADEHHRVYAFLQKATTAQMHAAGAILPGEQVALDTGVLHFAPEAAARLSGLAGVTRAPHGWEIGRGVLTRTETGLPVIDLYDQVVLAMIGAWTPAPDVAPVWHTLAAALQGLPLTCDVLDGEFTHVGTTRLFRQLMTEETNFLRLYETQQRLGGVNPPGVRSAGVIVDSVFTQGGELAAGAMAIECRFLAPVRAGRGAMLHGVADLPLAIEVPDDTVVHQVPVLLPEGSRGTVIRVYGVGDDPKGDVLAGTATWFGRPVLEMLATLGIDPELVWPEVPLDGRTLWNAQLFPLGTPAAAWACARWMLGFPGDYTAADWASAPRLSLAASTQWADTEALAEARMGRLNAHWQGTALSLALAGADIRPLLAGALNLPTLVATGRAMWEQAAVRKSSAPTEAASLYEHASLVFTQVGLADEAKQARELAFTCVHHAVEIGMANLTLGTPRRQWQADEVSVAAPARIDLGGGWSDTPPFCLDWGGTVLNLAIALRGAYPVRATMRRIAEPLVRCISAGSRQSAEYRTTDELLAPPAPGCPFTIPRTALRMSRLASLGEPLADTLQKFGGGLEITTDVALPLGSGLGTSSILAAAVLRALAEMLGWSLTDMALNDQVMRLEQMMTTGGGWQDQAGGIFPGAKLVMSGPGLCQRLRVQPLAWDADRQREFTDRLVLYYTGIRRMAKNLLGQIVEKYLMRDAATVQVLHSIKTLAYEMSHAMTAGEWAYLGQLLDRHWQANQTLDPHTTNAPINALLQEVRPYLAGAKLAGAGGGGFLIMLAHDPQAAHRLRTRLAVGDIPGDLYDFALATDGLRVEKR